MWLTSDEFKIMHASAGSISTETATSAEACARANMGRFQSLTAVVQMGINWITTSNLWVRCQPTASTLPTATTAIALGGTTGAWSYRYVTSSPAVGATTSEVLSARAAGTSTALVLSSGTGTMYIIEVKSDDLPSGYPFVSISVSSAAAFRPCTVTYFLKPRYPQNVMMNSHVLD